MVSYKNLSVNKIEITPVSRRKEKEWWRKEKEGEEGERRRRNEKEGEEGERRGDQGEKRREGEEEGRRKEGRGCCVINAANKLTKKTKKE